MALDLSALDAAGQAIYNQGLADGTAGAGPDPTPFSQSDVDAAVKAAVDPLNAQVASVQSALDAETVKDQGDAALAASLQAKIDQIKALIG